MRHELDAREQRRKSVLRSQLGRRYVEWEDAMGRGTTFEKVALTTQAAIDAHREGDLADTYRLLQETTAFFSEIARETHGEDSTRARELTTLSNKLALTVGTAERTDSSESREAAALEVRQWRTSVLPYLARARRVE